MTPKTAIVTGSSGLIGSEMVTTLDRLGWEVHGVDNNMRMEFFGPDGDTTPNLKRLLDATSRFTHHDLDVRDRAGVARLVDEVRPALIVHSAAQPSHDLAARRPFDDFEVNAVGTLNLLEAARASCPESPFAFLSTNKVYGDAPERAGAGRARDALGLRGSRAARGHRRELPDRRDDAQPVRRVEGRGRPARAGVRPLLRDAHRLLPRRLPHRLGARERGAARLPRVPRALHPRAADVPDLRLQGQAGAGQHPRAGRLLGDPRVLGEPARRRRSTTSAAVARTRCRSSKRSRGSRS